VTARPLQQVVERQGTTIRDNCTLCKPTATGVGPKNSWLQIRLASPSAQLRLNQLDCRLRLIQVYYRMSGSESAQEQTEVGAPDTDTPGSWHAKI
jgi:hypothetical protein